jgi:hypothetical protein
MGSGLSFLEITMTQEVFQQHLDEVLLFVLDVKLFHGNRKVNPTDLSAALGVDVTQDDVFTLGVKRVFDKEFVNKLNRVKAAMERACLNAGTPFLSGYAVPDNKADGVANELESLTQKGDDIKHAILRDFTKICDDYAAKHPQWESVIKKNSFSESYVRDRIQFNWRAIKVSAGRDDGIISVGLKSEVGGLLGSLLSGVSKAAKRFIDESLTGKTVVTRKALRPLVATREKLSGFTFLDNRVEPLCELIDRVVNAMPQDGPIGGEHLAQLIGMASILMTPQTALDVGEKVTTQNPDLIFDQLFQSAAVQVQPMPDVLSNLAMTAVNVNPAEMFASAVPTQGTPLVGGIHGASIVLPNLQIQPLQNAQVDYQNLFA